MQGQKMMRAFVLQAPKKYGIKELAVPIPADGQVLIKVMAAPVNPSDLIFLHQGSYEAKKTPCVPGFEGSGVVISSGGGIMGWGLMNKRVAFTPTQTTGTYAEYALAKASQCMPIEESLSFEHASMSFVNPLTAMALMEHAKTHQAKTVIVNAAASSLGRMFNRLLPPEGIEIINIVRKEEQVELLRKEGANFILNSTDPEFEDKLKDMAVKMHAEVAFDAIGGEMTGKMLTCMPKNSTVYVYGALDGANVKNIEVRNFIYKNSKVTGFFLPNWLEGKSIIKLLPIMIKLRKYLRNELKSEIALECSLDDFEKSVQTYTKNMTKGKVILKPFSESKPKQAAQTKQTAPELKKEQSLASQDVKEIKKEEKPLLETQSEKPLLEEQQEIK